MKRSIGILSVAIISTLSLTGCPSGGGSSNNAPAVVANGHISSYPQQPCLGSPNSPPCQNNGGIPGGIPNQSHGGLKSFTCQLQVRKGDAVYAGNAQQFYLPVTGGQVNLFANSLKSKTSGGLFRITRTYAIKLANVVVEYIPALTANTASVDQIKMSVADIDGDISSSLTGFAGDQNTISITPQDEEKTELIATCSSSDAKIMGLIKTSGQYQCVGTEKAEGKTTVINYVNQITDVVSSGISITPNVFVQGAEGKQIGMGGAVSFTQSTNRYDDSTVALKSSLSSATAITIEKEKYSLNVKCQPK